MDQEWVVAGKHPLNVHNGMGSPHVDAGRQQGGDTLPSMEGEFLELGEVNNAVVVLVENREQALDVIRLRREFQRLQPRLNLRRRGTQGSDEQGRIRFIICDLRVFVERSRSGYCRVRSSTTHAGVTRHSNRNKVRRTNCNAQRAIAPINQRTPFNTLLRRDDSSHSVFAGPDCASRKNLLQQLTTPLMPVFLCQAGPTCCSPHTVEKKPMTLSKLRGLVLPLGASVKLGKKRQGCQYSSAEARSCRWFPSPALGRRTQPPGGPGEKTLLVRHPWSVFAFYAPQGFRSRGKGERKV